MAIEAYRSPQRPGLAWAAASTVRAAAGRLGTRSAYARRLQTPQGELPELGAQRTHPVDAAIRDAMVRTFGAW
jgi:hypothetical protein